MQSFVAVAYLISSIVPPLLLFALRILSGGNVNYLPAGPTSVVFAILAQYYSIVPHRYTYRVAFSSGEQPPAGSDEAFVGLTFSDKSYRYLLAAQLALFQWPGSLLSAAVGWVLGHAWRNDVLPGRLTEWRVPGWLVGMHPQKRRDEFEGLRRRLEGENNTSGTATGVDDGQQGGEGAAGRRRPMGQQILDQFRGPI